MYHNRKKITYSVIKIIKKNNQFRYYNHQD